MGHEPHGFHARLWPRLRSSARARVHPRRRWLARRLRRSLRDSVAATCRRGPHTEVFRRAIRRRLVPVHRLRNRRLGQLEREQPGPDQRIRAAHPRDPGQSAHVRRRQYFSRNKRLIGFRHHRARPDPRRPRGLRDQRRPFRERDRPRRRARQDAPGHAARSRRRASSAARSGSLRSHREPISRDRSPSPSTRAKRSHGRPSPRLRARDPAFAPWLDDCCGIPPCRAPRRGQRN